MVDDKKINLAYNEFVILSANLTLPYMLLCRDVFTNKNPSLMLLLLLLCIIASQTQVQNLEDECNKGNQLKIGI